MKNFPSVVDMLETIINETDLYNFQKIIIINSKKKEKKLVEVTKF